MLNFGEALIYLRQGRKLARNGWNSKDVAIALQTPDKHSKMTLPYIYVLHAVTGEMVPWSASQTDILAEDWHTV
jgi:Protein of unknown function (DUF2829)